MKKAISIILTILIMSCSFGFMGCNRVKGEICDISKAYEQGWITEEDVRNIAYLFYGKLEVNGEEVEFTPTVKYNTLTEEEEWDIREAWYVYSKWHENSINKYRDEGMPVFMPYGYYHGCYAVHDTDTGKYIPALMTKIVAGIKFYNPYLLIFRYK